LFTRKVGTWDTLRINKFSKYFECTSKASVSDSNSTLYDLHRGIQPITRLLFEFVFKLAFVPTLSTIGMVMDSGFVFHLGSVGLYEDELESIIAMIFTF